MQWEMGRKCLRIPTTATKTEVKKKQQIQDEMWDVHKRIHIEIESARE